MPQTNIPAAESKPKKQRVVETVTMQDGTTAEFVGTRKMNKVWVTTDDGARLVRFELRNGYTRTFNVTESTLLLDLACHGAAQKIGDEASGEDDVEDMAAAVDAMIDRLNSGIFNKERGSGDSFTGAGLVIRALCEVTGRPVEQIKAYIENRLSGDTGLKRSDLYASFRNPDSATGVVIARLESEKRAKAAKLDAASEIQAMMQG